MARAVQRESGTTSGAGKDRREPGEISNGVPVDQGAAERRILRSRYLAVKNLISDERDDLSRVDMEKFRSIITKVESLHHLVQKPREQVADAEALLDIINTLVASVRSQSIGGVTVGNLIFSAKIIIPLVVIVQALNESIISKPATICNLQKNQS